MAKEGRVDAVVTLRSCIEEDLSSKIDRDTAHIGSGKTSGYYLYQATTISLQISTKFLLTNP
jgi:hypothetical protein